MPGGDRTGPNGVGPMTGWGAGYCLGATTPGNFQGGGYGRRGYGRGRGWGAGRGFGPNRGWRNAYPGTGVVATPPDVGPATTHPISTHQEIAYLKAQARAAKETLDHIEARISELKGAETPAT